MLKFDRVLLGKTTRTKTSSGFLRVPASLTRTGVFLYLAGELGIDGDPERVVSVLRTKESITHPDAMASLRGAPVTLEHPSNLSPKTFRRHAVGAVAGEPEFREPVVFSDLLICDETAIKEIEDGEREEISVGYDFKVEPAIPGDNAEYRTTGPIDYEHVAVVASGRAGPGIRVFDAHPQPHTLRQHEMDEKMAKRISDMIEDAFKKHMDMPGMKKRDGEPVVDTGAFARSVADALSPLMTEVKSIASNQQKAEDERKAAEATAEAEKAATALTDAAVTAERGRAQVFTDASPFLTAEDKARLVASPAKEILIAALKDKFPDAAGQDEAVLRGMLKGLALAAPGVDQSTPSGPATGAASFGAAGAAPPGGGGDIFGRDANSPLAQAKARFVKFQQDAHQHGHGWAGGEDKE